MMDVGSWLRVLGLERYEAAFRENEIDETVLPRFTADDLKDLGIGIVGHRRKLLDAIAALRADANTKVPLSDTLPTIDRSLKDAAERRHLTVMICDLVGSTALSARLDPEDLRGVIGAYHTCIAEVIGRYQGIIARYMGDGVLVYFGYPQAHEDDAAQGVRAGLALVDAVANLRTDFDAALKVRIGIATGTVVVGDLIGEGAAQEEAVVGETPNLAARLQAAAEPGTVVISASTRRVTGGLFECRDLGPVALKGWNEPTPAWQVVGASEVASRFEAQHTTRLTPLLGRDDEIEVLSRRWRDATQGEGRVVVLTGEPGIGKSHIALAFQERLQAEPHIRLRYYCSAHHTNSALFPFIGQLERAARFERGDAPAEKLAKLEALLMQSGVNAVHSVPILANLLSLPPSERHPLPELSPQKRKEATLAALRGQLEGLSARQPALVVFEDAHWIDPTSLELLAIMVERLPQLRVVATDHREAGVHAALAGSCACDDASADAPESACRVGNHRADRGRQDASRGGDEPDPRPHRWGTSVPRGADQDGARRRAAAGARRPLCARPSAAGACDSDDVARLADGAARPLGAGEGGGPDRRRGGSRVLLRAAECRSGAAQKETG